MISEDAISDTVYFERNWNSHCERDSNGNHCWERRGVITNNAGTVFTVWQCSQCEKIIKEALCEL